MNKNVVSLLALKLRGLTRRKDGVAAVEMALATPILLALCFGCAETALLMRTHFQAAHMASTVADVIARYKSITAADVNGIFSVSAEVMGSQDFLEHGTVVLTSVATNADADATVSWQCSAGELGSESRVGVAGDTATLPGSLALDAKDNVIVAEIFYQHQSLLQWNQPELTLIYKTALFRPRLGDLTTVPGC